MNSPTTWDGSFQHIQRHSHHIGRWPTQLPSYQYFFQYLDSTTTLSRWAAGILQEHFLFVKGENPKPPLSHRHFYQYLNLAPEDFALITKPFFSHLKHSVILFFGISSFSKDSLEKSIHGSSIHWAQWTDLLWFRSISKRMSLRLFSVFIW